MIASVLLLLGACWSAVASSSTTASNSEAVEQWAQWEIAWEAPTYTLANPFTSVELMVELHAPGGAVDRNAVVRGFYDGLATTVAAAGTAESASVGVWRARFMPPVVGTWTWLTHCSTAVLNNKSGAFTVVPPSSASNHGPVRTHGTIFRYADGKPFHVVGTTVYGLSGGVWGSNKLTPNKTAETLATLARSPFNKVRMMAFPTDGRSSALTWLPYEMSSSHPNETDPTRFNLPFWQRLDRTIDSLLTLGIQADIILFNLYSPPWPIGLSCLGGSTPDTYNISNDRLFLRYIVARIASFRNVWWSMSNEWNQCSCKFTAPDPVHAASAKPAGWPPAAATPAWDTPIWDELFRIVHAEDPSEHLMSIHNNAYLYNYSRPWISHFSVQHTHNKPQDLWALYTRKPFVWDEVKYEGDNTQNWGSLSAPQMVHRMWWGAATGAYGGHGESLALPTIECKYGTNEWSGNGGVLCGESSTRIAFFRRYIENTTVHPPFSQCEGSDDGYTQALHCGHNFHLFRFYAPSPYCNMSFKQINLPTNVSYKQELLDPWRMLVSPIWCGHEACPPVVVRDNEVKATASDVIRQPPPAAGQHSVAPPPPGWSSVGITVDDDSLPHILTFTRIDNAAS